MALAEVFGGPEQSALRAVEDVGGDVCPDCFGSLVIVDDDGSVSGTVGALIDCICVELAVPPGFLECHDCAALIRLPNAARDERLAEYLAFCASRGMEPAWCLVCGAYRPLVNGARAAVCGCVDGSSV
jgi:hypothetical protein